MMMMMMMMNHTTQSTKVYRRIDGHRILLVLHSNRFQYDNLYLNIIYHIDLYPWLLNKILIKMESSDSDEESESAAAIFHARENRILALTLGLLLE